MVHPVVNVLIKVLHPYFVFVFKMIVIYYSVARNHDFRTGNTKDADQYSPHYEYRYYKNKDALLLHS